LVQKKIVSKKKPAVTKKQPKVSKKTSAVTKKQPKTKKSIVKNKKDITIITMLSVLLLAIIVLLIVVNPTPQDPVIDNNDDLVIDNNDDSIIDNNNSDLDDVDDLNLTEDEIYAQLADLEQRLNNQIISEQSAIFESWYDELDLNETLINQCVEENNYANKDINIENAKILEKIMVDISLARYGLGLQGTPGIVVNGYKLDGFVEYDLFKKRIDAALADIDNNFPLVDYNAIATETYEVDLNKDPVLYVVYNDNHDFLVDEIDQTINVTKESDYNALFNKLYDNVEIKYTHFLDAPQNIKDMMAVYNVNTIPFFFIEGDISKINFSEEEKEMFEGVYYELPEGGYFWQHASSYLTDYTFLKDSRDYIIGLEEAPVTLYMFSDYDCGFCKKFEVEIVPRVIEDYVEQGKVNIVFKDFVIYEAQSLFPAVFVRCAQEQGKYFETHEKLFENSQLFGGQFVDTIMQQYMEEFYALQAQYEKLSK
jgi:protein-disulfide isomerase